MENSREVSRIDWIADVPIWSIRKPPECDRSGGIVLPDRCGSREAFPSSEHLVGKFGRFDSSQILLGSHVVALQNALCGGRAALR